MPVVRMRGLDFAWVAAALVLVTACARPQTVAVPPRPSSPAGWEETGRASWYGQPHDGRRTASGEVYDMTQMTAAHRTLPFGTWVAVDNLDNARTTEVRINDRGPFKSGRILDLSYAAARVLGATEAGEIPVRLRVIASPTSRSASRESTFTVQVGAFVDEDHAVALRRELTDAGAEATVERAEVGGRAFYRVRVGQFATRAEARERARHLAAQGHAVLVTQE